MIPFTYPSRLLSDGRIAVVVHQIIDITGLVRWQDYTPVKFIATAKDTYDNDGGHSAVNLFTVTSYVAGTDYINIYEDSSASIPWTDYIPIYKESGFAAHSDGYILVETGFIMLAENGNSLRLE
jgi:hypothetical protein